MTFEEYAQKHLGTAGLSFEGIELVRMGWNARGSHGNCQGILDSSVCEVPEGQPARDQGVQGAEAVGFVSQEFFDGKWNLDHISKTAEGRLGRIIPVYPQPQPAVPGEEIHVNVEGDEVYMLPLQPSGMESPRFVVHVPEVSHLEWSHTLLDGKAVTLSEAEEAVAKLGEGWRLPTRQELESLLDLSRIDPAIDTSKYPDTKSCAYWTGTPCAWNSAARWVVYFNDGNVGGYNRNGYACVRAVRDVEEGA